MKAQVDLIGLVVEDMGRSLAFYRELGLDVPDDAAERPHVRPGARPGRQRRRPCLPAVTVHSYFRLEKSTCKEKT
jgi:hypothetical protein